MKLRNFNQLFEGRWDEEDESYYNDDDYLFGRPNHSKKKSNDDDDFYDDDGYQRLNNDDYDDDDNYGLDFEDEEVDDSDDMSHLLYLLRTMFKNTGIEVEVRNRGLDIEIDAYLNKKERLKDVIKVFEVAKKLKKDVLPQYDSEFELFYSKTGHPILTFTFLYGDGQDDDNSPF